VIESLATEPDVTSVLGLARRLPTWQAPGYTREKAYVERVLDAFECGHPDIRVIRLRPGFIFKRKSAAAQRRLFVGPLLPPGLTQPGLTPAVPDLPGLHIQALHSADAGQAYRLAVMRDVRGASHHRRRSRDRRQRAGRTAGCPDIPRSDRPAAHSPVHGMAPAPRTRLTQLFDGVLRLPSWA
jgi:hypothetical protein